MLDQAEVVFIVNYLSYCLSLQCHRESVNSGGQGAQMFNSLYSSNEEVLFPTYYQESIIDLWIFATIYTYVCMFHCHSVILVIS